MGFGGISIWQLLIILVIVLLLFGTKRLLPSIPLTLSHQSSLPNNLFSPSYSRP